MPFHLIDANGGRHGLGDAPLAAAEVRVRGTSGSRRTDDAGRFSLTNLPTGTQVLEVRHVGYSPEDAPVELRSDMAGTKDMRLRRIVNLDSIRIVAKRSRYPQFEGHRQYMMFGRFLGSEELARQPATCTSDIVQAIPGFHVVGYGFRATVVGSRGSGTCRTNVVIDGAENRAINGVSPGDIGAIEAYRERDMAPESFDRGCGAIVIWTKR